MVETEFSLGELSKLLVAMNEEGRFSASILADRHGFSIVSAAADGQDADRQSAVVGLVQKTALQVQDQLGMARMDEISVYDSSGQRLVCRPFSANEHDLILAVLVPERRQPYRRLTTRTVNAIRRLWEL